MRVRRHVLSAAAAGVLVALVCWSAPTSIARASQARTTDVAGAAGRLQFLGSGQMLPASIGLAGLGGAWFQFEWSKNAVSATSDPESACSTRTRWTESCTAGNQGAGNTQVCSTGGDYDPFLFMCSAWIDADGLNNVTCSSAPGTAGSGNYFCSATSDSTNAACSSFAFPGGYGNGSCSAFGTGAPGSGTAVCSSDASTGGCSSYNGNDTSSGGTSFCSAGAGSSAGDQCSVVAGSGSSCTATNGTAGNCSTTAGASGQCSSFASWGGAQVGTGSSCQ